MWFRFKENQDLIAEVPRMGLSRRANADNKFERKPMKTGCSCRQSESQAGGAGCRVVGHESTRSWLCDCPPVKALRCAGLMQCLEQSGGRIQQLMVPEVAPRWKRWLDLVCIAFLAPVWVPLMLMLAVLIKCVSRGPVFFRQERLGFRGKPFTMFKFRTMKANADTSVHQDYFKDLVMSGRQMIKLDSSGDSRLIPLGGILRSAGLDELPQLLNVLWGEMSLVGPRPCTPSEASLYAEWHKKRFSAMPGLTGLWQVRGKNKTTFQQMICLDIYYATSMHLRMDIEIMLRTAQPLFEQVREFLAGRRRRVASSRAAAAPASLETDPGIGLAEQRMGK